MTNSLLIGNDRQDREARVLLAEIDEALSSESSLKALAAGLPTDVHGGIRRSLITEKRELEASLAAYAKVADGEISEIEGRAAGDPGDLLVVARLARGWTQKELARRLFVPEQQVQRYEAEKYRSVSLGNLLRIARTLGVEISANVGGRVSDHWLPRIEMNQKQLQKVIRHARNNGWLKNSKSSDELGINQLKRVVAEHVGDFGSPSLLRTGLNVEEHSNDWLLLAWKAQITKLAKPLIQQNRNRFRPTDLKWLPELVKLSSKDNGPELAVSLLYEHGIVLIAEKNPPGLNIDGAAFLFQGLPVIGMSIRHDRLDNFWFTLLHEVGHVVLHYRTGLASGFFDDIENQTVDELEEEANEFASSLLIPNEIWSRTQARITQTPEPIIALAKKLSISPSIVFGRIRKERNNYRLFSNKIGQNQVGKWFFNSIAKVNEDVD